MATVGLLILQGPGQTLLYQGALQNRLFKIQLSQMLKR